MARILVVDDDQPVVEVLQKMCKMSWPDVEVDTASGVPEALAKSCEAPPDILIADFDLEDLGERDGFQLATMVVGTVVSRGLPTDHCRVIVISADFTSDVNARIGALWFSGVYAFPLRKPIDLHVFRGLLTYVFSLNLK